jgi:hypothetical protein
MEVGHGVGGVVADVEDEPVAGLRDSFASGDLLGRGQHLGQEGAVLGGHLGGIGDMRPGYDQDVDRRRGRDIPEGVGQLARGDLIGWNVTCDDGAEQAVRDGAKLAAGRDEGSD